MEIVVGKKGTKISGETDFGEHSGRIGKPLASFAVWQRTTSAVRPVCLTLLESRVGPSVAGRDGKGMDIDRRCVE